MLCEEENVMALPSPQFATPITLELVLSIIAIAISFFGLLWTQFKVLLGIERRLVSIETKTDLWWDIVSDQARKIIKQPIHFRKDDLLDRFPNLNDDELCELKNIIATEKHELEPSKDPKLISYAIWTARIEMEYMKRDAEKRTSGRRKVVCSCKKFIIGDCNKE
jgi:hypothetical protein